MASDIAPSSVTKQHPNQKVPLNFRGGRSHVVGGGSSSSSSTLFSKKTTAASKSIHYIPTTNDLSDSKREKNNKNNHDSKNTSASRVIISPQKFPFYMNSYVLCLCAVQGLLMFSGLLYYILPKIPSFSYPGSIVGGLRGRGGRRWLAFLHIGKAGGTSFDPVGVQIARETRYLYMGRKHFDWSYIMENLGTVGENVEVVTLLREPVDRAISHYYFFNSKILHRQAVPLEHFLWHASEQDLLDMRDFWQDGQAGVSWFTGTHIASWVGCPQSQVAIREARSIQNTTDMMHLAADRLETTKWFGLLEDLDRSMELLQHAFGLTRKPSLRNKNKNQKRPRQPESENVTEALRSLMPQDLWLYEYAKRLFEARWDAYQTKSNVTKLPARPPIPQPLTCISTRFTLNCTTGPFANKF